MQTDVYINFLRSADLPGVPTIRKIIVSANRVIDINFDTTGGEILNERYDFSSAVSMEESGQSPNGYPDLIYRYHATDDLLKVWIACVVPEGTDLPEPVERWYEVTSFPQTLFLAEGVSDGGSVITGTVAWAAALSTLSDAQKKARAIAAFKDVWRPQTLTWTEQANARAILSDGLVSKVRKWLIAADRALQIEYQKADVDYLVFEKMCKLAAQGALDITDVDTFMISVHLNSQTPTVPCLWVNSTPERVNLGSTIFYTDQTIPADYNARDESWLV